MNMKFFLFAIVFFATLSFPCFNVTTIASTPDIGHAILVAGDDEGWFDRKGINSDTNKAYQVLQSLGFDDSRILYLNSDSPQDVDNDGQNEVDMVSSFDSLQYALTEWASARVGPDSPLILYMAGHGTQGNFYLTDISSVSPIIFLDGWLSDLPQGTLILVVIDACYSGSFIISEFNGEISEPNRILITSSDAYSESDSILLYGSLFSHKFWDRLEEGKNLKDAFIEATDVTNRLGMIGGKFWDPRLDDNGDALGHSPLFLGDDGELAATMTIGMYGGAPSIGEDAPDPALFEECYVRNGGAAILGYPVNRVHWWMSGYIQDFRGGEGYEGAIMQPNDVNSAYAVYGSIWSKYLVMGGAGGPLGYPLLDETEGPPSSITGARCRYNKFEGGAIVHRKETGPYESKTVFLGHGIFNKWEELGYGVSALGLPVTDEYKNDSGYPQVDFEAGYITTIDGRNYQSFLYSYSPSGQVEFPIRTPKPPRPWPPGGGYDHLAPAVSGNIVAWLDRCSWTGGFGNTYEDWGVSGYDIRTRAEFPIRGLISKTELGHATVSGNIVVWHDKRNGNFDIYGYNLSTQTEMAICTHSAQQINPDISGDVLVWTDERNGNKDIYGFNLSTYARYTICKDANDQEFPAISGNIVIWQDKRNGYDNDIYGYNLSTQTEFSICTASGEQERPAITGNIVVWQDYRNGNWDIYGYDLSTQTEFAICTDDESQVNPAISGNIVVWQDNWTGDNDIYGYNLATQRPFAITFDSVEQVNPDISGNIVVWQDNRNGRWGIYGKYISSHDECDDAIPVLLNVPYSGSTQAATGTDVTSCGYNDKIDVWHCFTPPATYDYTISLCGSSFNTTLAVFDNCGGTELACNDDTQPGICPSTAQSQLTIPLVKGSTYLIRIAGYNAVIGDYTLTVIGPRCTQEILGDANNDCKIDFVDFAIMASNWLECNLDPPELCW